jgi:hypothetical protein
VMNKYLVNHPDFATFYIQSLADNLKKQCARSERFRLKSARERCLTLYQL